MHQSASSKTLLAECSKLEHAYLRRPKHKYRLLSEVSLSRSVRLPNVSISGAAITFNPKGKIGFKERSKLFQESRAALGFSLPKGYSQISVHVSARTEYEASEAALNAIDLVRASWNLSLNRGKRWRYSSGRPTPINDIRLSPFHTVHDLDGSLSTETYWYDPGYVGPVNTFVEKSKLLNIFKFSANLRTALQKLSYRRDIEAALVRYVRALDSADLSDTFLRLWSLLEFLTDSTHDPYKVATRRASFLFSDQQRSKLVLTHLTNYRNRFVHTGSGSESIEYLVFQLKQYVDKLLVFHIGNKFGFSSRSEAANFMDLPANRSTLNMKIKRLRQAKSYVSPSS